MRIKRIEADSVNEAMRELRRELGDHAIILHTKQLPARGVTAWFKTPRVEILGAVDEPVMRTGVDMIGGLPTLDREYHETPRVAAAPAPPPVRQDHQTRERVNHHVAAERREPATSYGTGARAGATSLKGTGSRAGATSLKGTGSRAGATPVPAPTKAAAAPKQKVAAAARAGEPQIALTGYAERRARLDGAARPQVPATARVAQPAARATSHEEALALLAAVKGGPGASVKELIAQATARQTTRQDIADRLAKFRSAMPFATQRVDDLDDAGSGADGATPVPAMSQWGEVDEGPTLEADASTPSALTDPLAGITCAQPDWTRAGRRPRRIAFVGPTGGGKTTTLAKVAARAQLEQGRRVGIVTIDTYRIGAVPQLQAYADILGAPLAVADTPEALADALARMNDLDIVFIDTIGRSPLGGGVEGLAPFLSIAAADEVHLVLSAITRPGDSMRAARAFARLVPNRLSITKIDETEDHSALAMVTRGTGLPLQWLGTGQEVPDDLDAATPDRLLALVAAEYAA